MADRKKVDPRVEALVLAQSARRCCMCFRLRRDLSEKLGQIAHLDHDPANGCEDNLAYLCMDHHSLYDSRTSQHKNYTLTELTEAREDLYREVAATKPTVRLIDRFDQRVEPKATTRNWLIDRIVQLTWQIILAAVLHEPAQPLHLGKNRPVTPRR